MRCFLLLVSFTLGIYANSMDEWTAYKTFFKKDFSNEDEEMHRMRIYFKNKKLIREHNAKFLKGLVSYTMKANHLTDMEPAEVRRLLHGMLPVPSNRDSFKLAHSYNQLPDSVDWRQKGFVSPVRDQGECASAVLYSVVGSIESQYAIKTGILTPLSTQNVSDCYPFGCSGTNLVQLLDYIKDSEGISSESCYHNPEPGECKSELTCKGFKITGYVDIISGDEDALKTAVATVGPISVAIDASAQSFQFYTGGVYDDSACSSQFLDHELLLVGYGTENGQDYWICKNSWGVHWGEKGYIRIARNKNNMCGIATYPLYPTI